MDNGIWTRKKVVEAWIPGVPVAQGSLKAWRGNGMKFAKLTSTAKGLKQWRALVANALVEELRKATPPFATVTDPLEVDLDFRVPKPKSEPKRKPTMPVRKPDLDKLLRAVLDAMTGVVYQDDSQVVKATVVKNWPGITTTTIADNRLTPGVNITVWRLVL